MAFDFTGLGTLASSFKGILGLFKADETAKVEAQSKLEELAQQAVDLGKQQAHDEAMADIDLLKQQIELNKLEANSESWIAKNWRPLLCFGSAVTVLFGIWSCIITFALGIKSDFGPLMPVFDIVLGILLPMAGIRSLDKHLGTAPSSKTSPVLQVLKALPVPKA